MDIYLNRLFPIRAIGPGICLVHKDRYVAILEAIPINFALRAPEEQERLIKGYANFLNGLNFPVQLFVRSDFLRVDEYLADLKSHEDAIEAHLRPSLGDYIQFLRETVSVNRLVKRRFYIVMAWQGHESRKIPRTRGEILWDEAEHELIRRREILIQGLRPLGIRLQTLDQVSTLHFLQSSFGQGSAASERS
ncbi:hypothetical protein [Sulfobacillus thermosulfidooxidans]|uniref:hypothetical protein n=1 Tax=Sulfobacillus thermosulfidooxidans TaxID=28034 RepID=UPI000305F8EC|nr:hypothetical protein [Sulfobacillus thermosulfidooxidans]